MNLLALSCPNIAGTSSGLFAISPKCYTTEAAVNWNDVSTRSILIASGLWLHCNSYSRRQSIFNVIMCRTGLDKLFFQNICVSALVVPDLLVLISMLQGSSYTFFLAAFLPVRPIFIDRQCQSMLPHSVF